ncbi:MAG: hypothetical protein HC887_04940 [Desulfobacteraceae bacterium]|nr:hypothetical protein [Desulfobacteraceae bacterium]
MITLTAGEHNPTIDAGLFMPSANSASLGDVVWFDTDHNGIQNPGEPGIAGITVNLLNASGVVISTTVTDGTGYYEFTGLAPGSYAVEFVKPSDTYSFSPQSQGSSTSADSDANTSTGRTSLITLGAGEHNPRIDAGLYIPNTIPASLGNFVWYDSNHNGIQEQGELGIAGVTVHLLDASGKTVATTVTDGMGFYQFTGLIPGQYSVEFVKPDTYVFSPKAMGYGDLKDAFDSDADSTTGKTGIITLSGGENNPKIDAGLYIPGTDFATISDKIWYDVNQDGIQDSGEPGIPGVTVRLYDENGRLISTIRTDSTGFYIFSGLPRGDYIIEVEPPEGYSFSPENTGNDDADSDVNPQTGRTVVTILASGERNIKVDAGLYSRTQLASLGNYVWYDSNRNGIQDADETGISGITVNLYDKTGTTIVATTLTDADGHYSFNGLLPGDYLVGFGLPGGYVFSPQSQGADTGADSNANPNTGLSSVITLKPGENNPSIDAGVYVPNPIRLGDLVFWDKNNDGQPSSGEGIANVTVHLYDGSGNLIATTVTDSSGHYEFPNLPPGDYRITVDTSTLPSGVKPFFDADGVLNSSTDVKNQTTDDLTLDFGYRSEGGGEPPVGTSCSISNFVWKDSNHNGIQDAGELGVPGVRVNLYAPDGSFLATTVTDENGYYIFDNLMPGTYMSASNCRRDMSSRCRIRAAAISQTAMRIPIPDIPSRSLSAPANTIPLWMQD